MNTVGDRETGTQERVVAFFQKVLGYTYLGNWQARQKNSNIDTVLLSDWLRSSGHDEAIISKVLFELEKAAALGGTQTLVDANREVYERLRYGVNVQPNTGEHRTTVKLIDWEHPFNNDFGIAEGGNPQRREHQTSRCRPIYQRYRHRCPRTQTFYGLSSISIRDRRTQFANYRTRKPSRILFHYQYRPLTRIL